MCWCACVLNAGNFSVARFSDPLATSNNIKKVPYMSSNVPHKHKRQLVSCFSTIINTYA